MRIPKTLRATAQVAAGRSHSILIVSAAQGCYCGPTDKEQSNGESDASNNIRDLLILGTGDDERGALGMHRNQHGGCEQGLRRSTYQQRYVCDGDVCLVPTMISIPTVHAEDVGIESAGDHVNDETGRFVAGSRTTHWWAEGARSKTTATSKACCVS